MRIHRSLRPILHWRPILVGMSSILLAAACTDDPTGPAPPDPDVGIDITGRWSFSDLGSFASTGGGPSVSGSRSMEAVLELTQDGTRITGRQSGTRILSNTCSSLFGCVTSVVELGDATVRGTVSGDVVVLELVIDEDGTRAGFEGRVEGDRIEGEDWSASRLSGDAPGGEESHSPPAAPSNLQATVDESDLSVRLTWTDHSDDEDGFAVFLRCDAGEWGVLGATDPDVTAVRITGFQPGETCDFAVVAFREVGEELIASDPSNVVTVDIP